MKVKSKFLSKEAIKIKSTAIIVILCLSKMIVEEPVQQGMLLFPPQGMLGQLKVSLR